MPLLNKKTKEIIDWSGHSDVHIEVQNMASPWDFLNEAERLMALVDSDPHLKASAVAGRTTLVLPRLSTLAAVILAYWHGRFGYFPKIKWYVRDAKSGQFSMSDKDIDLQQIRYDARRGRGG